MYDLHNHLLPGIDDGAPNVDTALELAQIAVADGITHMVCTPHIHPGRFDNTLKTIQQALKQLQSALLENHINLQISAAAEVRLGPEILQGVQTKSLPFLGQWQGKDVLLLEFPSNTIPLGSEKLTKWLLANNVVPIIAHPERNSIFQEHSTRLDAFINQGCLTQVTASALLGWFGLKAQNSAELLLAQDKITIMASDAHNIDYRPPRLTESFEAVKQLTSLETAQQLFIDTPKKIAACHFMENQHANKA